MDSKFLFIILAAIGAGYFLGRRKGNFLEGGLGDHLKIEDVDPDEFQKGIEVEMEHTRDKDIAGEIALDHLAEDPHYYTKLATIENPRRKKKRKKKK